MEGGDVLSQELILSWIRNTNKKFLDSAQTATGGQPLTKGEEKCLSSWKITEPRVVQHCLESLREESSKP